MKEKVVNFLMGCEKGNMFPSFFGPEKLPQKEI